MDDTNFYLNQLEKIHKIQLDIALEIKRICNKYDIKYSLIAGTLLGAVRHEGFIPWDDDLDIGMLRTEYDKFIKIAKNELSDEYFLQTWDTDKEFGMPFAKVRRNGTIFVEKNSSKTNQHKGIYIDIFPFDIVPTNQMIKKLHNIKTYLLKRVLIGKLGYEVWSDNKSFKYKVYKLINLLFKPFSLKLIKKILDKEMTRYRNTNSKCVVAIGGSYGYEKETIEKEWLENLQVLEFEKKQFTVPIEYTTYLMKLYGDYMSLPPEGKRYNRHEIIEIDFGEEISWKKYKCVGYD